jgi:hypothetical protein
LGEREREGQRVFGGEGEMGENKRKEKDQREGESSALIERRDKEIRGKRRRERERNKWVREIKWERE